MFNGLCIVVLLGDLATRLEIQLIFMVSLRKYLEIFMTSFFSSTWNIHDSVADHLRSKTSEISVITPAQRRKQWIAQIKEAISDGNCEQLATVLQDKHRLKDTDLDVFGVLAEHYSSDVCEVLVGAGLSLQLNWNHFPYLLKQHSADFVARLWREEKNCLFSTSDKTLHQSLWEGMSGLYIQSVRRAFAVHCTEREHTIAVAYIRQLETQFPQLTQEPYRAYCAEIVSPLAWSEDTIEFLEQRADVVAWDKHFPQHDDLKSVLAFLGLCQRSAVIAQKYTQLEKDRAKQGETSRKLAKCFEGKDGVATSYPAFSMVKWIKACDRDTQEQEFMENILSLKRPEHVLLGMTPKQMYLSDRISHTQLTHQRTRHGSWDLPTLTSLSWFHDGVSFAGEIVDVMLQSEDGVASLNTCLDDPSVLMGFLSNCSIAMLHNTLKRCPHLLVWRDAHNNSIGHYIAISRTMVPKGLAEVLIKSDAKLLSEANRLGVSAVDIMQKVGGATPLAAISKMLLAVNIRENGDVRRKVRGRTESKRRM